MPWLVSNLKPILYLRRAVKRWKEFDLLPGLRCRAKWAALVVILHLAMASNRRGDPGHRSPPLSPSPPQSLATSEHSGRSNKSACQVCWRQSCQLTTHRDYARRATVAPTRPSAMAKPSPKEQEPNFPIEMKANMRQLYHHCKSSAITMTFQWIMLTGVP